VRENRTHGSNGGSLPRRPRAVACPAG